MVRRRAAIGFMTDFVFVDTDVLIYARDLKAVAKRKVARAWLYELTARSAARINLQVMNQLTRWLLAQAPGRPLAQVRSEVDALRSWGTRAIDAEEVDKAWDARSSLGYSWYDCLLVAAADRLGCRFFLTEDMTDGARFGRLTLVSPFQRPPAELLART